MRCAAAALGLITPIALAATRAAASVVLRSTAVTCAGVAAGFGSLLIARFSLRRDVRCRRLRRRRLTSRWRRVHAEPLDDKPLTLKRLAQERKTRGQNAVRRRIGRHQVRRDGAVVDRHRDAKIAERRRIESHG